MTAPACYSYKRSNHFAERIDQQQMGEPVDIPQDIYNSIFRELHMRHVDKDLLDVRRLRMILTKLGYRSYRDHAAFILFIINGREPPIFTTEIKDQLIDMFKAIQAPFELYTPPLRKNFLNYDYILHQFCLIMNLPEHAKCFPLYRNQTKLQFHDSIWSPICSHLSWPFNPTYQPAPDPVINP
ncbi:Poxvirus Late Transcription Factor VLTF3 like [uncultured virus]|nr:Poxvirus Late Transcription Factor VLTF3 like [uncultured virus]